MILGCMLEDGRRSFTFAGFRPARLLPDNIRFLSDRWTAGVSTPAGYGAVSRTVCRGYGFVFFESGSMVFRHSDGVPARTDGTSFSRAGSSPDNCIGVLTVPLLSLVLIGIWVMSSRVLISATSSCILISGVCVRTRWLTTGLSGDAVFDGAVDSGVPVPISVSIMLSGFPGEGLGSLFDAGWKSCAIESCFVFIEGPSILTLAEVKGFSDIELCTVFSLMAGCSAEIWCAAGSLARTDGG